MNCYEMFVFILEQMKKTFRIENNQFTHLDPPHVFFFLALQVHISSFQIYGHCLHPRPSLAHSTQLPGVKSATARHSTGANSSNASRRFGCSV